jgi:fructose/tagatose bisphosphate aldolase
MLDLDDEARALALCADDERPARAAALRAQARAAGVYPASIGPIYRALAEGRERGFTVPAFNLRGLTYDLARAIWQAALGLDAGPIIFELAPSEAETGRQPFDEFVALALAAALREGYRGPAFFQGDHFRIATADPAGSPGFLDRCREALAAGMRQIDLDAGSLTGPDDGPEGQATSARTSAVATGLVRALATADLDLVIGAEVGEIGGRNTTPRQLQSFMEGYLAALAPGTRGMDKISVQTGTAHGGIVSASGSLERMPLDLELVARLSTLARASYGLPGLVQHGASTLAVEQLGALPGAGVCEVHLATQIQNLVFDHPAFPAALRAQMIERVPLMVAEAEHGPGAGSAAGSEQSSPAQRFYQGRWLCWGAFKADLWGLPEATRSAFREALADWAREIMQALQIAGRRALLDGFPAARVGRG